MSPADRSGLTAADFIALADHLPEGERHELVAGELVAMAPGRARHALVKLDCALALREAVRKAGSGCTVFGDGMSVIVSADTVYEPDVLVQCDASIDLESTVVERPVILIEVLSPSTRGTDTGRKLAGYFRLESVMHYLVVDPDTRVVVHHRRAGERIDTVICGEGSLKLDSPGLEVAIADLFVSLPK